MIEHEGWMDAMDVTIPGRYYGGGDLWRFREDGNGGWEWFDDDTQEWRDCLVEEVDRVFRIPPDLEAA